MSTKAVFTMKLDPELRDTFMAEATAADRPAAQVIRELMRDYIEVLRRAREYDEFLRRKVEYSRKQRDKGAFLTQESVEAEAATRQIELLRKVDAAGL